MRIKSYFADSMAEAMDKARAELGPEAMLISSRQTEQDLKELGLYEIVFGVPQAEDARQDGANTARTVDAASQNSDVILRELTELRKQVESFRSSVTRTRMNRNSDLAPELQRIFDRLLDAGFSDETARDITEAISKQVQPRTEQLHRMVRGHMELFTRDLLDAVVLEEVGARFQTAPSLGEPGSDSPAVFLIGPPGAGKTTMLMKLGLRYGMKARRPTHVISLDTLRIGGWEQLSTFSRITGASFEPLHHPSTLQHAVAARTDKGLTLVDTPGLSKADETESDELAEAARQAKVEVQLVLPANLSLSAAQQVWKRFAKFEPVKLILTRTDETDGSAPLIEFAMRSGLPISFLSNGQQVPEDMREADKAQLTSQALPAVRAVSVAA